MLTESSPPVTSRGSWPVTLLASALAVSAVACGSIVQSTLANPWLNVLLVIALLLPVLRGEIRQQTGWLQQYYEIYRRALLVAGLGWALVTAGYYLVSISPYVGSVDLFYYLCNARDMNQQVLASNNAYSYFPGVYTFWKTVLGIAGENFTAIQRSYLPVIVINILLVGVIVWQHSRSLAASLFAGTWFLVLISRFQASAAETELLATIPLLLTVLCWAGRPLQGRRGWADSLLLGVGLGLMLFMKQQAGLLSLGALAMLAGFRWRNRSDQHQWGPLLAVPFLAAGTFLLAVLTVGEGWTPLQIGLATVGQYAREGSWGFNLYVQVRRDETAALAALLSGIALVARCRRQPSDSQETMARLEVILFLAIGALATLWQLRSRAYHHYMLLAAPGLVITTVLLWLDHFPARDESRRSTGLTRCALILLVFVPFLRDAGMRESFTAWRIPRPHNFAPDLPWHQQAAVAGDLARLQQHLPAKTSLYTIPHRHNSVYFMLQAHSSSPAGYRFQQAPLDQVDWSLHRRVLLLKPASWDESDRQVISMEQLAQVQESLLQAGFQKQLDLPTMVLYEQGSQAITPSTH